MTKEWVLTQEDFDRLLAWLGPDPEQAGRKYEEIRRRLIKIFACRGCGEADQLADETINRVARRLPDFVNTYTGDPVLYFCGVAQKVHLEYLRRKPAPAPPPAPEADEEAERAYACLDACMNDLAPDHRRLVLQYYMADRQAKINHRKELADALGIAINALRIRAFRIRAVLQRCIEDCMQQAAAS